MTRVWSKRELCHRATHRSRCQGSRCLLCYHSIILWQLKVRNKEEFHRGYFSWGVNTRPIRNHRFWRCFNGRGCFKVWGLCEWYRYHACILGHSRFVWRWIWFFIKAWVHYISSADTSCHSSILTWGDRGCCFRWRKSRVGRYWGGLGKFGFLFTWFVAGAFCYRCRGECEEFI